MEFKFILTIDFLSLVTLNLFQSLIILWMLKQVQHDVTTLNIKKVVQVAALFFGWSSGSTFTVINAHVFLNFQNFQL